MILDSLFWMLDWWKGFESLSSSAWARRFGPPKSIAELRCVELAW